MTQRETYAIQREGGKEGEGRYQKMKGQDTVFDIGFVAADHSERDTASCENGKKQTQDVNNVY